MAGVVVAIDDWYRETRRNERCERCRGALEEMEGGLLYLCMRMCIVTVQAQFIAC